MDAAISWIAAFIAESAWFAPLAAFAGGVLTSFTPCSLSGASLAIAYVGGVEQKGTSQSLKLSLVFALGTAVAFCALGIVATAAGSLLGSGGGWLYIVLGVLMLAMALQVCGIIEIIPSTYLTSKNTRRGYAGALVTGVLAGIFASPCSTPVLIALLAVVASSGSIAWSAVMLVAYSVGHSILAVIAGTSTGFVRSLSESKRYGRLSNVLKYVMGAVIALIGIYLIYTALWKETVWHPREKARWRGSERSTACLRFGYSWQWRQASASELPSRASPPRSTP